MDATKFCRVKNTAFQQKMEAEFAEGDPNELEDDFDEPIEEVDAEIELP